MKKTVLVRALIYCAWNRDKICDKSCAAFVPTYCLPEKLMVDLHGVSHPTYHCLPGCKDIGRCIDLHDDCGYCGDCGTYESAYGGYCARMNPHDIKMNITLNGVIVKESQKES